MAKCKLSGVDFVHSVFSPSIAILSSSDAEAVCEKNNLSFTELLKPFSRLSQDVHVKDTSNISHVVHNLQIIFQDMNSVMPQPAVVKKLLADVVANCHPDPGYGIVTVGNYDVQVSSSTPWFEAYRVVFLATLVPSEHEFVKHCLGCVMVVSTAHPDPMDQFARLTQQQNYQQHQQPNKLPRWFSSNVLKFYLLLHDTVDGDLTKAESVYQTMKSTYGTQSCHLLQFNSRPPPTSKAEDLPDPWLQYLLPIGTQPLSGAVLDGVAEETTEKEDGASKSANTLLDDDPYANMLTSGMQPSRSAQFSHPLAGSPTAHDGLSNSDGDFFGSGSSMRASASLPHLAGSVGAGYSNGTLGTTPVPIEEEDGAPSRPLVQLNSSALQVPHGQCMTPADIERVRAFVYELTVKALLPWVERTMKALNDQIASKMRLSRSFLSGARKFFGGGGGGGSGKPSLHTSGSFAGSGTGGSHGSSATSTGIGGSLSSSLTSLNSAGLSTTSSSLTSGSTSVVYTAEAPELQMRRYADLAFLFQQYEVAHQTYNVLKKEFQNDSAWLHYAGSMEMSALSVYIQGAASQRQYPHHYMETAITHYLNTCRNVIFATRATLLNAEALKSRGLLSEASVHFIKLTTEDNDLRSALLLEQAAHCYVNMRVPMVRKYAFHMVLAGHRFSKAGQRRHAIRCYTHALQVYKGRSWSLAEDHINFTIGRHSFHLRNLDIASAALQHLLAKESRQSPAQQAVFLREYIFVLKQQLQSLVGDKTLVEGEFPQLPLPMITANQVKVMLGRPVREIEADDTPDNKDISVEARGVQFSDGDLASGPWARLEEVLVASVNEGGIPPAGHVPTLTCLTRETPNKEHPKTPVGEAVTVQIPLENPVQVPLVLTELYLLWQFVPAACPADGPAGPRTVTNETERDRLQQAKETVTTEVLPDFYLLPGERKPVELCVVPKQLGCLHIVGMAFSLGTASPNQQPAPALLDGSIGAVGVGGDAGLAVSVKGKLPLEVQGRKTDTGYGTDRRLDLVVVPAMPLLKVVFSEFPSRLACGEVRRMSLQLSNIGQQPLTRLRLATSQPGFLTFGFDEFAHTLESTVYQTLPVGRQSVNSQAGSPSGDEFLCLDLPWCEWTEIPLVSPGVLAPGASVTLPCWIRGGDRPNSDLPVHMLFFYQSTETNPHIRHRVLRHSSRVELVPSLQLRALAKRSRGTCTANLLISLEANNTSPIQEQMSTEFAILQVSGASKHWTVKHLMSRKTSDIRVNPAELICLCLRAEPSRVRPSPGQTTVFSNVLFDQREMHSAGTPCADFYYLCTAGQSNTDVDIASPGSAASQVKLTMIVLWKMIQLRSDASIITAVGQSHVTIDVLDQWAAEPPEEKAPSDRTPVRFGPAPELDPSVQLKPLLLQSKMVRLALKHPHQMQHDFKAKPLLLVAVEVQLYNAGDVPVFVRVEPIEADSSIRAGLSVVDPDTTNPASRTPQPRAPAHFGWVGLSSAQVFLPPRQPTPLTLTACLARPGVYELHNISVKAAILPANEDEHHVSNLTDLVFVKQTNAFSSLFIVDGITT